MIKPFCQLGRMLGVVVGCSIPSTAAASGLELCSVRPIQSALPIVIDEKSFCHDLRLS